MKNFDYIIVGQGLAGTILSYTFLKRGKKILVIDDATLSSCSKVAAGNYNPIVFKRLVKSWKADEVIPYADNFFYETQKFLNAEFFWKKEVVKIFADEREKKFWLKKSGEEDTYLSGDIAEEFHREALQAHAGCGTVKNAGKIYSARFLELFRNYFVNEKILVDEKFDFDLLEISDDSAGYKDFRAKKIIFCEGWKALENPYFSYLPFKPAKGEILLLKIENLRTDKIIHKNGYLYSIGSNLFVAGSTYEWSGPDDFPTEKGKKSIIEKLEKIISVPYEIIGHFAGVRPSAKDRRPFIGLHPHYKTLGIFNGFGAKAVMLAPYFAGQFFEFLEDIKPLDEEVNIKRFH